MAPAFSTSPQLVVAAAVAAAAFASSVALLVALVVLRVARDMRDRRLAARVARWRSALHAAMELPTGATPPVPAPRDLPVFLRLSNHLQETIRGEASENLSAAMRAMGLLPAIHALVARRGLHDRLVAITALGHLRDASAWDLLAALSRDADAVLSFASARALLRIDAPRALEFLAEAVRREDWSLARLGTALQEAGPDVVTPPIERLLADPAPEGLERLLKLARFAHRERVAKVVRGWLGSSRRPLVILAALNFVEDAADLASVRGAARHADWRVRMAAARALGRIGTQRELALLLGLLADESWWVRYHAAQSIGALPGVSPQELEAFRVRAPSALAAGMLEQVMAERARA